MPPNIDPVQFGQLINAVENLTDDIHNVNRKLDEMSSEVQDLIDLRNSGKGIIIGLMLAGGSIGAAATHLIERLFK